MPDLFDFLEKQEGKCFHLAGVGVFSIYYQDTIFLDCGGSEGVSVDMKTENANDILYKAAETELPEFRICSACGKPISKGFVVDDDAFCEGCFPEHMDEIYGAGNWKPNPDEESEYCYMTRDGKTYIDAYYTEWYE